MESSLKIQPSPAYFYVRYCTGKGQDKKYVQRILQENLAEGTKSF